jgi:hypothetical protein
VKEASHCRRFTAAIPAGAVARGRPAGILQTRVCAGTP